MFSVLFFLPVLSVGRSFANPLSTRQHFSFSSLRVRSTDDGSSAAAELKSSLNSIYADATSWTSGPPGSFRWNEATAAQIFSTSTDSDLLPEFRDSNISGTPDSKQKGCRAQFRGKFRIRDDTTSNQGIGEERQFCSPAEAPANGGKPFNSITPPESGVQPPTGMDQSQNTQPPQKVQQVKDIRTDEEKQNELRTKNAALSDEDPMKCRHTPHRIRLDCDGPLGEARVSVYGLDYKEIWNCYPGMHARQQDLRLCLKQFLLIMRVADETPLGRIYFSYSMCCIKYYVSFLFGLPDFHNSVVGLSTYIRAKKKLVYYLRKRGRMSADVECLGNDYRSVY